MDLIEIVKSEGNQKQFKHKGYECLIIRTSPEHMGHLCGYIQIPKDHKLYDLDYYEIEEIYDYELPAHGGLTFAGELQNQQGYWMGFDCAHLGDFLPMSPNVIPHQWETYKDMKFVENNIKEIIDFLKEEPT